MQYRAKPGIIDSVVCKNEHPVSCAELCCRRGSGSLNCDPNVTSGDNLIPPGSTRHFCRTVSGVCRVKRHLEDHSFKARLTSYIAVAKELTL